MKYSKPFMKTSELVGIGLSRVDLYRAAHSSYGKSIGLVVRSTPKGAMKFDTSKLEKVFSVLGRAK